MSTQACAIWGEDFTKYDFGAGHPMAPVRLDLTMRLADSLGVLGSDRVRVLTPGRYEGFVGVVVKRGRTRFHVRGRGTLLTVPFDHVEAA